MREFQLVAHCCNRRAENTPKLQLLLAFTSTSDKIYEEAIILQSFILTKSFNEIGECLGTWWLSTLWQQWLKWATFVERFYVAKVLSLVSRISLKSNGDSSLFFITDKNVLGVLNIPVVTNLWQQKPTLSPTLWAVKMPSWYYKNYCCLLRGHVTACQSQQIEATVLLCVPTG